MSAKHLLEINKQKVREKWGKSEKDIKEYLDILKAWLETQKHLPEIPDDNTIEFILTNCKYSIEKTKANLDMYYTIRDLIPEYYTNSHPIKSPEQSILSPKMADYVTLPKLTNDLCRITLIRYKKIPASEFDLTILMVTWINIIEVRFHEDLVMGEIFIIDGINLTLNHAVKFNPVLFKRITLLLEKVWSHRMKGIHIVNVPPFVDTILSVAKAFVKKKLYERVVLHQTYDSLQKYFPIDILPSDYGGNEKSLEELGELWRLKFRDYSKRFDELEHMKVNEELREESLENSEILGYYGNFRKLDVD